MLDTENYISTNGVQFSSSLSVRSNSFNLQEGYSSFSKVLELSLARLCDTDTKQQVVHKRELYQENRRLSSHSIGNVSTQMLDAVNVKGILRPQKSITKRISNLFKFTKSKSIAYRSFRKSSLTIFTETCEENESTSAKFDIKDNETDFEGLHSQSSNNQLNISIESFFEQSHISEQFVNTVFKENTGTSRIEVVNESSPMKMKPPAIAKKVRRSTFSDSFSQPLLVPPESPILVLSPTLSTVQMSAISVSADIINSKLYTSSFESDLLLEERLTGQHSDESNPWSIFHSLYSDEERRAIARSILVKGLLMMEHNIDLKDVLGIPPKLSSSKVDKFNHSAADSIILRYCFFQRKNSNSHKLPLTPTSSQGSRFPRSHRKSVSVNYSDEVKQSRSVNLNSEINIPSVDSSPSIMLTPSTINRRRHQRTVSSASISSTCSISSETSVVNSTPSTKSLALNLLEIAAMEEGRLPLAKYIYGMMLINHHPPNSPKHKAAKQLVKDAANENEPLACYEIAQWLRSAYESDKVSCLDEEINHYLLKAANHPEYPNGRAAFQLANSFLLRRNKKDAVIYFKLAQGLGTELPLSIIRWIDKPKYSKFQ